MACGLCGQHNEMGAVPVLKGAGGNYRVRDARRPVVCKPLSRTNGNREKDFQQFGKDAPRAA